MFPVDTILNVRPLIPEDDLTAALDGKPHTWPKRDIVVVWPCSCASEINGSNAARAAAAFNKLRCCMFLAPFDHSGRLNTSSLAFKTYTGSSF
jgi:hypothetical protein